MRGAQLSATREPLTRCRGVCSKLKDRADCPPELKMFAGKQVRGALAGRVIKPVDAAAISARELCELWMESYTVLLPSGDGLGWKSSCHFTV